MAVTRTNLLSFMRAQRLAAVASRAPTGEVQAAAIGIAVTDDFELIFDTLETTRKARNIADDPRVAVVIGGMRDGEERTVQYEGVADRLAGTELPALQREYLTVFPEGNQRLGWPGLIYIRVKPKWLRYSDYRTDPPTIVEFGERELAALG